MWKSQDDFKENSFFREYYKFGTRSGKSEDDFK